MRIIHTVWHVYFAGLKFRKLLFDNILLNKFREFTVKTPHPHNGRGVLHLKTPVRAELNYHGPLLHRCVVFCDSLPHFNILRVRFQIPGPHLHRIELAALALADIAHDGTSWENSPCGPGSLLFDCCPSSLLKYTNRAIKLTVAHVRWNTVHVGIGAQHVSKCNFANDL